MHFISPVILNQFYNNHLYGIQNGIGANTVNFRMLVLNDAQDAIVNVDVIDSHNPDLDVPLTFCLVEDQAVVIGNSNLGHLDQVTMVMNDTAHYSKTKLLVYSLGDHD